MPRLATLAIWLSLIGAGAYAYLHQRTTLSSMHKIEILKKGAHEEDSHRTSKVSGPLIVETVLVGEPPQKTGDTFEVEAQVTSEQNLQAVKLEWIIAPSTQIQVGSANLTVDLRANETFRTRLTLKAMNGQDQHVILRAKGSDGALHFAQSGHYNNKIQLLDFKPPVKKALPTSESTSFSDLKIRQ